MPHTLTVMQYVGAMQYAVRRCQFEFASTVHLKGPDSLHMLWRSGGSKQMIDKVPKIHVEDAEYHFDTDRKKILKDILQDFGSYEYFDTLLQLLLLLDPLDYSADLNALRAQGAAAIWNLQPLVDWASRTVNMCGGAAGAGQQAAGEGTRNKAVAAGKQATGASLVAGGARLGAARGAGGDGASGSRVAIGRGDVAGAGLRATAEGNRNQAIAAGKQATGAAIVAGGARLGAARGAGASGGHVAIGCGGVAGAGLRATAQGNPNQAVTAGKQATGAALVAGGARLGAAQGAGGDGASGGRVAIGHGGARVGQRAAAEGTRNHAASRAVGAAHVGGGARLGAARGAGGDGALVGRVAIGRGGAAGAGQQGATAGTRNHAVNERKQAAGAARVAGGARRDVERGGCTGDRRVALGIFGGAGEGKSTLSALAVDPAGGVNVHVSSRKLFVKCHVVRQVIRSPFQAWHFCKHNDKRRQDVLRIIKTLAFQLGTCKALPDLWIGATVACFCDVYTPP